MTSEETYSTGLGELRAALIWLKPDRGKMVALRNQVIAKYQPIFSPKHIPGLLEDEFTSFLYFENNHHWTGLYRKGRDAASDMDRLRKCLAVLLDENKPLRERFPQALDMVSGLGKGIATAILTVAYPEKYGVWNDTSEKGLHRVGLWPKFKRGEDRGGKYEILNDLLLRLSSDLKIDLWTLDWLWWGLLELGNVNAPGIESNIKNIRDDTTIELTEKIELIKARKGQGTFRQKLLRYWKDCCAVTGYKKPEMLFASHIKPWSVSSNAERLDPFNGLLLTPNLNQAFDRGFITFDEDGVLAVSPLLTEPETLGIASGMRVVLQPQHRPFMAHHRKHVYHMK
jgi:hypothetical protein